MRLRFNSKEEDLWKVDGRSPPQQQIFEVPPGTFPIDPRGGTWLGARFAPACRPRGAFSFRGPRPSILALPSDGTAIAQDHLMLGDSSTVPFEPIPDHFLADHRRLEELASRMLIAFAADDRDQTRRLWTEFDAALSAHLEAEEMHLVPVLLRFSEREARGVIQEHRHIRSRLAELGAGIDLHIVGVEELRAFVDELRAHARHEDTVLYGWAESHLDPSEHGTLFRALAAARDKFFAKIR